jgi:hypothetical protein
MIQEFKDLIPATIFVSIVLFIFWGLSRGLRKAMARAALRNEANMKIVDRQNEANLKAADRQSEALERIAAALESFKNSMPVTGDEKSDNAQRNL